MHSASFGACSPVTDQAGALTNLQNVESNDIFWTNKFGEVLASTNALKDRLRLPQELGTQALSTALAFFVTPLGGLYFARIGVAFGGPEQFRGAFGDLLTSLLLDCCSAPILGKLARGNKRVACRRRGGGGQDGPGAGGGDKKSTDKKTDDKKPAQTSPEKHGTKFSEDEKIVIDPGDDGTKPVIKYPDPKDLPNYNEQGSTKGYTKGYLEHLKKLQKEKEKKADEANKTKDEANKKQHTPGVLDKDETKDPAYPWMYDAVTGAAITLDDVKCKGPVYSVYTQSTEQVKECGGANYAGLCNVAFNEAFTQS